MVTILQLLHLFAEYYSSCKEALDLGESCSGMYKVKPDNLPLFEVS